MTILAATDRSENSKAALLLASKLSKQLSEPLVVVSVLELWEQRGTEILPTFENVDIEPSAYAEQLLTRFVHDVLGAPAEIRTVVGHPPTDAIIGFAQELNASLIVAGTSGHSRLVEAFFGSTISALVRRSPCPVLAVPPNFVGEIRTILAPVDFSECSQQSLAYAGELSERLGAELLVQHSTPFGVPAVAPPFVYVPADPDDALVSSRERLAEMVEHAGLTGRAHKVWTDVGPPHPDILYAVEENGVDMVVMGTHGRTGLAKFFLGSTAERMLRDRKCPVLVVRGEEE